MKCVGTDNKPDKIYANGRVVVDSPSQRHGHRRQRRL